MKNKLILSLAVLSAVALCSALAACSQEGGKEEWSTTPSEGLEFTYLTASDSYAFTGLGTCTDENVVIPATYEGKSVTQVGLYKSTEDMFTDIPETYDDADLYYNTTILKCDMLYRSNVKSVYIPDGVTTIGYEAFGFSDALEKIRIPDTVNYIGDLAFTVCTSLKEVTIPEAVTVINFRTFNSCVSLEKVTLGSSVTAVYRGAFRHCSTLKEINLSDTVTLIGGEAFSQCYRLKSINLTDNITYIGDYAFENCDFSEIYLGSSLTTLREHAFESCANLKSVTIPKNVTAVGQAAFSGCSGLEQIVWNAENAQTTDPDDVTDPYTRIFGITVYLTKIEIGEGVKELPDYLFYRCSSVTTLTLPSSLEKIGDYTFYGITITQVTLSTNTVLGTNSFSDSVIINRQ
jgi:hypothetical protein